MPKIRARDELNALEWISQAYLSRHGLADKPCASLLSNAFWC